MIQYWVVNSNCAIPILKAMKKRLFNGIEKKFKSTPKANI
jgi:hypothetical protein